VINLFNHEILFAKSSKIISAWSNLGSARPVLSFSTVLSLFCPEFQDRTKAENIETCPDFCPRPEDRTRTENNKTCPNFCPVKKFSLKIIYF
jgi:hypothetical protein